MFDGRRSRIASVVAAAAGWLIAGATAAMGATGGVTLAADAGLDGVTRPGRLTRVRIAIESSGHRRRGQPCRRCRKRAYRPRPQPAGPFAQAYRAVHPGAVGRHRSNSRRIGCRGTRGGRGGCRRSFRSGGDSIRAVWGSMAVSDPRCTSTLDAAALPDSWRGGMTRWTSGRRRLSLYRR